MWEKKIFCFFINGIGYKLSLKSKAWKKIVNKRAIINCHICCSIYNVLVTDLEVCVVIHNLNLMIWIFLVPGFQCIRSKASGCQLNFVSSVCQILKRGKRLIIRSLDILIKACFVWEREIIGFCSLVCISIIVNCNIILATDHTLKCIRCINLKFILGQTVKNLFYNINIHTGKLVVVSYIKVWCQRTACYSFNYRYVRISKYADCAACKAGCCKSCQ